MAEILRLGDDQWLTNPSGLSLTYSNINGKIEGHFMETRRSSVKNVFDRNRLMYELPVDEAGVDFKSNIKGELLLENTQTNIINWSEDIRETQVGGWSKLTPDSVPSITGGTIISPRGVVQADEIEINSLHAGVITSMGGIAIGNYYSFLTHLKFTEGTTHIRIGLGEAFANYYIDINSDGSIGNTNLNAENVLNVTSLPNGWIEVRIENVLSVNLTLNNIVSILKMYDNNVLAFSILVDASDLTYSLPYTSDGNYSGTIYWGDGTTSVNSYANKDHIYTSPGEKYVIIQGEVGKFNNIENTLINIDQFGLSFSPESVSFNNLQGDILTDEILDLSDTLSLKDFVSNSPNLIYNGLFPDLTTDNIETMENAFKNATSMNQDISVWNYSGLNSINSLDGFMEGKDHTNFECEYYTSLLAKWNLTQALGGLSSSDLSGGTIHMGGIMYDYEAILDRQSLLDNKVTTIIDGGLCPTYLLQEDGDFLLQENNFKILL